jgi:hypothetical protein
MSGHCKNRRYFVALELAPTFNVSASLRPELRPRAATLHSLDCFASLRMTQSGYRRAESLRHPANCIAMTGW